MPLRRAGLPSETGDAVARLGSGMPGFVTGHALVVEGGLTPVI
jgi:hypothetical protein